MQSPFVILITGNQAAGKSSVAQALAERFPKSVHLRGDVFRKMIVNGRAEPGLSMSAEATNQLRLRYQIAAKVAAEYVYAGFSVVYQDVIIGPMLDEVVRFYDIHPLYVIVLCPTPDAIAEREAGRNKSAYEDAAEIPMYDRILHDETPHIGYWLDTSELSIEQTVDDIVAHLAEAFVIH